MKSKRLRLLVLGAFLSTAVFYQGASDVRAQAGTTTGALTGTVVNAGGAPLPGAAIRLINGTTGQLQTTNTDLDGRYGFLSLNPGVYAVQFSGQGFKTANISGVVVNVSEETGVGAHLESGASSDPIACQCTVTHAESSSGGNLMDSKAITSAPLTSRNVTQTFTSAAGAAGNVNNAGLLGNSNQVVSVNGQGGGNFTIDGARSSATPNPDTISQFRIQTTQYDAGYGARVPTTNLVTRSGANDFHGALWEFVRNNIFNANDYFSKQAHRPRPDLKQNQFGGAVGGPIKRDQLFFFGSYQGTRQVNGLDPTSLSTVILPPLTDDRSPAALGAQFGLVPLPGGHYASCANPAVPLTGSIPNKTFAGGTQVACNGSNINPIALKILQMKLPDGSYVVPTPQALQSNGLGRSSFSLASFYNEDQYLGNIDYVLSKKHSLAGRFLYSHVNQMRSFGASGGGGPAYTPGAPQTYQNTNYVASLKLATVLTSNLVNEARMTFSKNHAVGVGPGIPTATSLGMVPLHPFFDEVPQISVQGLGSFQFFGNNTNDSDSSGSNYSWADNLSWIHGKHAIRTGVFYDIENATRIDVGPTRGKISFQNFTDFMVGLSAAENGSLEGLSNIDSIDASVGAGPRGEVVNRRRNTSIAAFVQDDIKLHPRFTFNLGLRWERLPPTYDLNGQMGNYWYSLLALAPMPPISGTYIGSTVAANYDPNIINPHTGQPFGPPPAGVLVRDSKSLYATDGPWDTFAPRIGFAWQPGSKQGFVSVRMGYGWFYQATSNPVYNLAPFSQDFTNSSASNGVSNLTKPFPTTTLGFQLRTPTSQFSHRMAGPVFKAPTVQQWNLTIQLALRRSLSLDVAYVGSYGTHIHVNSQNHSLNQPLLATPGHPINCGLPNTAAGLGVSDADFAELGVNASGCVTTNTSKNAYLRTPILGETPTSLGTNEDYGVSAYNGLQGTLRKQISRGLSFQVSYTFSKAMANTGVWQNDQNIPRLNWARTNRAQRLVFSYSYEIPQFVRSSGFPGKLLTGWSVSGVTSIQSGSPLTLTDRRAGSVYGRAGIATITMCPGASYQDIQTSGHESSRLNQWFNKSAICSAPVVGDDGLATGYGTAGQSIINGPAQNDWDISLGKATRVGGLREDAQLQLRVEFYNAFNHPQFSNPGTTFGSSSFGVITQTSVAPRLIQFGLKYLF